MDIPVEGSALEATRAAELEAGRARFLEMREDADDKETKALVKAADKSVAEDEGRRKALYEAKGNAGQAEKDRAGAEVADQAQTMLEGVLHLANREQPIIERERQLEIEALEGDADPKVAHDVTVDLVTAQAVNQPTILASERGVDTEDRPLNLTTFRDEDLSPATPVPSEGEVPKVRPRAEQIARDKVPPAEKIVHADFEDDAVKVVRAAPDEALS